MKIKVINCKYLFINSLIEDVKTNIKNYHQDFMIANDTLYLPYYVVLSRKFTLPSDYETTIIKLSDVTDFDDMASYFYNVTSLSIEDVIYLCNNQGNFDELLNTIDDGYEKE